MAISEVKKQIVLNNYFEKECDINTSIREAYEKGFELGLQKAPNSHKTGKWIPVKERLPEKNGVYLVYVRDDSYCDRVSEYMSLVYFSRITGEFAILSEWHKALAWMPCPEPYKEEEE